MIDVKDSVFDDRRAETAVICLDRSYRSAESGMLERLDQRLQAALDDSTAGVLLDFGHNSQIGCGFLNVLLQCYRRTTETDRRFALCGLKPLPTKVLEVTRLNSLWEVFQTRREAIEAMRPLPLKHE